jgi:hypothetical protein
MVLVLLHLGRAPGQRLKVAGPQTVDDGRETETSGKSASCGAALGGDEAAAAVGSLCSHAPTGRNSGSRPGQMRSARPGWQWPRSRHRHVPHDVLAGLAMAPKGPGQMREKSSSTLSRCESRRCRCRS